MAWQGRVGPSKVTLTGDVVDYNADSRITNVAWYQRTETFLPSRVPQLQTNRSVVEIHRLGQEINTNGGLQARHT